MKFPFKPKKEDTEKFPHLDWRAAICFEISLNGSFVTEQLLLLQNVKP